MIEKGRKTPELVLLFVLLVLVAVGLAVGGGSTSKKEDKATAQQAKVPSTARVRAIERKVEKIRGLKFKRPIVPRVVTNKQSQQDQLREVDRSYPPKRRRADEELLEVFGLVPPKTDLKKVLGAVSGEQVVGYYDTRRKTLALVSGNGADAPVFVEITLAHELTHALEDQNFHIHESSGGTDDESSAMTALLEGSAVSVENDFTRCCVNPGALLKGSLGALGSAGSIDKLPPYIQHSLLFPYQQGAAFVDRLRSLAGGWKLVDVAHGKQPPQSTEQIMHPEKYAPFEPPLTVKLRTGAVLGSGWKRTNDGTLGEFDTREMLRLGAEAGADQAAAGWGGGSYELWQRPGAAPRGCGPPCRSRDVQVAAWRWDTPRDAREFEPVLRAYVAAGLHGRAAGPDIWKLNGGVAAIASAPSATTLVFAPDAALARRVAARAQVSGR